MESCVSYKNLGCGKQKTCPSDLLNIENQRVLSLVVMVHSQHQKAKRKFCKLDEGLYGLQL